MGKFAQILPLPIVLLGVFVISSATLAPSYEDLNCASLIGLRFYDIDPLKHRVETPGMDQETKSIVVHGYSDLLHVYVQSETNRQQFISALKNKTFGKLPFPQDFKNRLKKLPEFRQKRLETLFAANRTPSIKALSELFDKLFSEGVSNATKTEKQSIYEGYSKFFGVGVNLKDLLTAEGRIDIEKLLQTKRLATPEEIRNGSSLIRNITLKPEEVEFIAYAIYPDSSGNLKMRLSILTDFPRAVGKEYGRLFHVDVAHGHDVDFAGNLSLTSNGALRAIDLDSGHYMYWRQKEIDAHLDNQRSNLTREAFDRARQKTITLDETMLKNALTKLGITVDSSTKLVVRGKIEDVVRGRPIPPQPEGQK